ncbi:sigma-70 family RNA polymerase sigma factor [Tateyamaria omphalii]|uniref:RNA polymerase sigma factor n=1 Tax=Tateyamaria omphalii TaxID=299262 RepID=UPI001C99FC89|nr:sigma-70 family RNA polymerase sigma factor [Tateyamaria omphalii]MBY5933556.1 sigma-70 family RNA polymerase sigma factor [Tateyamaria omphalii]
MTDQSTLPKREPQDAALLARIGQGDMSAMKTLYEYHADAVARFVRPRVRDAAEADDIVHDTMLSVWRGAAGFQGRSSVRSWILTLARNKTVDHIRKQARVTLSEADDARVDDAPNPEAVMGAAQDAARLRACLDKLPDRQRAAIHLAFYEEMSCAEVAVVENVPEGTVKSRIYHAKKLLMRCLSRGGLK